MDAWLGAYTDGPQGVGRIAVAAHLALIEADLAEPSLASYPCRLPGSEVSWPSGASAAYRWGVAYVVEGSQLGGAVLYKRLAQQLAPHPLRYLRGPARCRRGRTGPALARLHGSLARRGTGEEEVAEACAGACDAFDRILALAFGGHRPRFPLSCP